MSKLKTKKNTKTKFGSLRDSVHSIRAALTEMPAPVPADGPVVTK